MMYFWHFFTALLITATNFAHGFTIDKRKQLESMVRLATSAPAPISLTPESYSPAHNSSAGAQAVFTSALNPTYIGHDFNHFLGTLRNTGFKGDIVVAVMPGISANILQMLKDHKAIVYTVPLDCSGKGHNILCKVRGEQEALSLIRFYLYRAWALKYAESASILVSDFRDVFFQSNPFKFKKMEDWGPPTYDLVLAQEAHPNRVINRCSQNAGFITTCYDWSTLRKIGSNTISSSGVVFGSRNAMVVYSYMITEQADPKTRALSVDGNITSNDACMNFGVDQGFQNVLLYSGKFDQYMNVKVFQQGEGLVNTVGGFYGEKKLLKALLQDWKILRGESPFKYVYNWNGEISPIVHQMDRFLQNEIKGGYRQHLAVFQKLGGPK